MQPSELNVLNTLQTLSIDANYSVKDLRSPSFPVHSAAEKLEHIASALVATVRAGDPSYQIGYSPELQAGPNGIALRFAKPVQGNHISIVDVIMIKQGMDLNIKLFARGSSLLKYFRPAVYCIVFIAMWLVFLFFFTHFVHGLYDIALVVGEKQAFEAKVWAENCPQSLLYLFLIDPIVVMRELSTMAIITGFLIGSFLYSAPPRFFAIPCRWLGWPTQEEYEFTIGGNATWILSQLGMALAENRCQETPGHISFTQ